jgi:hypothetical protein
MNIVVLPGATQMLIRAAATIQGVPPATPVVVPRVVLPQAPATVAAPVVHGLVVATKTGVLQK